MHKLMIIGGGFAGFWGALSAVREARVLGKVDELELTLISKNEYHTIKPRLYEQDLEETQVKLKKYCEPLGINLIVSNIISIDPDKSKVILGDQNEIIYDTLILAAGSQLKQSAVSGIEKTFNVDTNAEASRLDAHLKKLSMSGFNSKSSKSVVVVGGGATGIEVATTMLERLRQLVDSETGFEIHLVDINKSLAPGYSDEGREYIKSSLKSHNIELHLGEELKQLKENCIQLSSGKFIETETVIWTAGVEANVLSNYFDVEKDGAGRLQVDQFLRLPKYKNVFVAGDMARVLVDDSNYALMSCQHAMPQGKFAGHNAVSAIFGQEMKPYSQPVYATCLNLGPDDALFTTGWNRDVQMKGADARELKTQINTMWIYPAPDVEKSLEMSLPTVETGE